MGMWIDKWMDMRISVHTMMDMDTSIHMHTAVKYVCDARAKILA